MRITRRTPAFIAASVATALLLAGCGGEPAAQPSSSASAGGSATAPLLTIGTFTEPTSWDPAQANEGNPAPIYQAVYDTLVRKDPNGDLSPMLATSWEESEDGLTWTLKLRDDVTFTDGAEFNADAVVANIEHFKSANGPMASSLATVQSASATDESTVELTLAAPNPGLPDALSNAAGYMGSPDAITTPDIATAPVGSGPYVLDTANTVTGSKITFTRNEDYWGDPLPFDKVEFQVLTDETARLNALKTGQIMVAKLNSPASALDADSAGFTTEEDSVNFDGILFLDRDGTKIPELADPRVREALTIAIDRDAIVKAVGLGKSVPTSQTFGPDTEGFQDDLEDAYQYDPEKAKELLADAGASDLKFTLPMSPVFDPAVYNAIIQNWKDVGVTVDTFQWGPGEALPSMLKAEWPIVYMSLAQRADWPNVTFEVAPTAPWNPFHNETEELNALIAEYQTGDESSRADTAKEINSYLVDNFWFAPISRPQNLVYYDAKQVKVEAQAQQAQPSIYNYSPVG